MSLNKILSPCFLILMTVSFLSLVSCGETQTYSNAPNTTNETTSKDLFKYDEVNNNTYMLISDNNYYFKLFDFYANHSMLITSNDSEKKAGQWTITQKGLLRIVEEESNAETVIKRKQDVFTLTGPYAGTYQGTPLVPFKDDQDFANQAGLMTYKFGDYTYQFGSIEDGQRFSLNGTEIGQWDIQKGSVLIIFPHFRFYLSTFGSSERDFPNNNVLITMYDENYNLLSMEAYRYQ